MTDDRRAVLDARACAERGASRTGRRSQAKSFAVYQAMDYIQALHFTTRSVERALRGDWDEQLAATLASAPST
jgi:hypothetical protein